MSVSENSTRRVEVCSYAMPRLMRTRVLLASRVDVCCARTPVSRRRPRVGSLDRKIGEPRVGGLDRKIGEPRV